MWLPLFLKIKKIYPYGLLLLLLTNALNLQSQEKPGNKTYFKVGVVANQFRPMYRDVDFIFSDPSSGVSINKPFHFNNTINNYGINVGLVEIITKKGFVITPFDFSLAFNSKAAWMTCGTGGGYEITVLKTYASHLKREKKPFIKFRVGTLFNYGFYENYLFDNVRSANSNPIHVEGQQMTSKMNIDITKNAWIINPNASLSFNLTKNIDLRFVVLYNLVLSSKERLYFYESRLYYSKYSHIESVKTDESKYIFDASNHPVTGNMYTIAPLSFRVELSFLFD